MGNYYLSAQRKKIDDEYAHLNSDRNFEKMHLKSELKPFESNLEYYQEKMV